MCGNGRLVLEKYTVDDESYVTHGLLYNVMLEDMEMLKLVSNVMHAVLGGLQCSWGQGGV